MKATSMSETSKVATAKFMRTKRNKAARYRKHNEELQALLDSRSSVDDIENVYDCEYSAYSFFDADSNYSHESE